MNTGEDWDIDRYVLEVAKVRNTLDSLAPRQITIVTMKELVAHFPDKHKTAAFSLLMGGYRAHELKKHELNLKTVRAVAREKMTDKQSDREWERERSAFWVGAAMLMVALAASAALSHPSDSTSLLLRIIAGGGLALLIGGLPGLLSIDTAIKVGKNKVVIRATGGIAGFIMVYLFDPGWVSSLIRISK